MLSNGLEDRQETGVVDRTIVDERPVAVEHALTERGRSRETVIEALEGRGKSQPRPAEPGGEPCR